MDHDKSIKLGDGGRSEEKRPKIWEVGQRRIGAMLSVQSKSINCRFVFSWLPPDVLTSWPSLPNFFYQPKIWLAHSAKTFFNQTKIWRMNYNQSCKSNNFVNTIQPQLLQIIPIIYQQHNYMDPDTSIKLGDGGGSEEKRPKI